eukprot:TRINITY_DN14393_c0_g1_i1.p1 TRINITY_DN14393_c0_g1~~TRINITY_DN14393_c0_g1_i1.p1  ORF type:complete len:243 (-),score=60.26 TRINITY_DN14393_c0_g1_i1:360-1088(-)
MQETQPAPAEAEGTDDDINISQVRSGSKILFRPQLFWQEVLSSQMAERGLDFRLGIGGKNYARIMGAAEVPEDSAYALSCAKCVDPCASPGDEPLVDKALREAATWGDPVAVRKLLCSCYCTPASTGAALGEAAAMGFVDVVQVLLNAGARPTMRPNGKTALHRACEEGQEQAARALIQASSSWGEVLVLTVGGEKTAFELAKDLDMGGMAKRLEQYCEEHLSAGNAVVHQPSGGAAEQDMD